MVREYLLAAVVVPPVICIFVGLIFGFQMKKFAEDIPVINTESDLERFKRMAKCQMYAALAAVVLIVAPPLFFFYGWLVAGTLQSGDIIYIIIPGVFVIMTGVFVKGPERTVQNLEVPDDELRAERDRVVDVWLHSALPDW